MNILDEPIERPISTPIWNTVLRYGLYCGIVFIIGVQILYQAHIGNSNWAGMLIRLVQILLICLICSYFAIKRQRDFLDLGFITFGKAILVSSLSIYLGFLLLGIWNYLFINFIEPEYLISLKEEAMATWQNKVSSEVMDQYFEKLDALKQFPTILKNSLLYESPVGILGGIVIAFFMSGKK